jgi:hypothetical protein
MWTRADLKQRARNTFKLNYWKCVLVALIFALVAGNVGSGSSGAVALAMSKITSSSEVTDYSDVVIDYSDNSLGHFDYEPHSSLYTPQLTDGFSIDSYTIDSRLVYIFAVMVSILILVVAVIACVMNVFLFNPLEVGCDRFFIRNLHEKAQVGNVGFAFDTYYLNNVKTLFFRDLYLVLWTLLFIIPGIVKAYEYRMIPYILAENPHMSRKEVFAASKSMMMGNKWKAFVLDLSFLGWHILSVFTVGILELFYVAPYVYATNAALYEALAYGRPNNFANNSLANNGNFAGNNGNFAGNNSDFTGSNSNFTGSNSDFTGNNSSFSPQNNGFGSDRYTNNENANSTDNGSNYGSYTDNANSTDNNSNM